MLSVPIVFCIEYSLNDLQSSNVFTSFVDLFTFHTKLPDSPEITANFLSFSTEEHEYGITIRGNLKLMYKQFEYIKSRSHDGVSFWRCAKSRDYNCKGKAMTRKEGRKEIVIPYDMHNHCPQSIETIKIMKIAKYSYFEDESNEESNSESN